MSIMPLSEFSGEKNESRDNRVIRWRERYYRQEACIATIKAQRDELLAACKEMLKDLDLFDGPEKYIPEPRAHYSPAGRMLDMKHAARIRSAIANAEATPCD